MRFRQDNPLARLEDIDAIIVGGGLAGCHAALQLRRRGWAVRLYAGRTDDRASEVAAGALNPVTGRRLALTWRAGDLLPAAFAAYREAAGEIGAGVLREIPIRRFCLDSSDVESHARRIRQPEYADFLGPLEQPGTSGLPVKDELGSFVIGRAGHVELPLFIAGVHRMLAAAGALDAGCFDHVRLDRSGRALRYRNIRARCAVFCEGAGVAANPWFNWLPIRPVGGDILRLAAAGLELPDVLVHHRKWLLPLPDGSFRVGSTYRRGTRQSASGQDDAGELLEAFRSFVDGPPEVDVLEHRAGVRPCSRDFRPYAGAHPEDPRLLVLNGLGSKGALFAPWLASMTADHLVDGAPLDPQTDCRRHAAA